ncbi:epoxyqueuosine reductase QueH [bacterium]|nr:MAG: epoxyqueuosine reductase QueH [bacterium]
MKILLHTCCAPCLIYPLRSLQEKGSKVKAFYYNPNIHPFSEYNRRKEALETLSKELRVEVESPEYRPSEFFQAVNNKEVRPERCAVCWSLRLGKTARQAKEEGFDAFTSSLLVSPYQDQEKLKELGAQAAREAGVEFYYEDFRPGFRKAHEEAKLKGIYCQKYCGCIYSEIERCKKPVKQ